MGEAFTAWHRRHRVDVRCGVGVAAWEQGRACVGAQLTDGAVVEAYVALVAVGAWPDVGWLGGTGLDLGDGVLCGPTTHVVGAEGIVAAGDFARWPNLRFDETPRRVGHSANAVAMGHHAADALPRRRSCRPLPFTPIPWGFTEQFGACTQLVGRPAAGVSFVDVEGRPSVMRGAVAAFDARGRFVGGTIAGARPAARWVHDAVNASCPAPAAAPRVAWDPRPHLARARARRGWTTGSGRAAGGHCGGGSSASGGGPPGAGDPLTSTTRPTKVRASWADVRVVKGDGL